MQQLESPQILAAVPTPMLNAVAWIWFMMQVGMIAGLATTYPMNWFLIRAGIKEKM